MPIIGDPLFPQNDNKIAEKIQPKMEPIDPIVNGTEHANTISLFIFDSCSAIPVCKLLLSLELCLDEASSTKARLAGKNFVQHKSISTNVRYSLFHGMLQNCAPSCYFAHRIFCVPMELRGQKYQYLIAFQQIRALR